jgi:hypothetical protein
MERLLIEGISVKDLLQIFREIVREELSTTQPSEDKFLSPRQARELWSPAVSRPTLNSWESKGLLSAHWIGRRKFYKESDLHNLMNNIKR